MEKKNIHSPENVIESTAFHIHDICESMNMESDEFDIKYREIFERCKKILRKRINEEK